MSDNEVKTKARPARRWLTGLGAGASVAGLAIAVTEGVPGLAILGGILLAHGVIWDA